MREKNRKAPTKRLPREKLMTTGKLLHTILRLHDIISRQQRIMKKKIIPKAQIMIYDRIIWFSQKVERFLPKPIGVSLFAVGRKSGK